MNFTEHDIVWDDVKVSRLWNFYSRTPPFSEIYFSRVFGDRILRKSRLPLDQPIAVLDFGCGPGFIWEHLRALDAGWTYTGLDFSSDSVSELIEKAGGHPQFKQAIQATRLPTNLPAEDFDVVLLLEVVEHLKDESLDSVLAECRRVLKRGGMLLITTPNEEDLSKSMKFCPECGAIFHEWQHVRSWSASGLEAYMQQRGFKQRFATATDFAARGWLHRIAKFVWRMVTGQRRLPHLITGFQKV